MKKKTVYLLSGIPGSGKSTWAQKQILQRGGIWHSRDEVRFSLLEENDSYFQKEDEVFKVWINQICESLNNPEVENIYVDATHLNNASRDKTLNNLPKDNIDTIVNVIFDTSLETCLDRNSLREGRKFVPEEQIMSMASRFNMPDKNLTILIKEGVERPWERHL